MSDKKDPSKSPRDTNGPVVETGPNAGKIVQEIAMGSGGKNVAMLGNREIKRDVF
ncbi:hypothetical protein [Halomonas piscis]|uniref:hypothetical protein n=1 Tax=Halomonas piscis TaxID=3031727 RepID=UPI00289D8C7D|nr:hypothetical protein [Halomonas piscis]